MGVDGRFCFVWWYFGDGEGERLGGGLFLATPLAPRAAFLLLSDLCIPETAFNLLFVSSVV